MATQNPAAKTSTPKEKKPAKPLLERIDEQIKKQVVMNKVSAQELTAFQEKLGKYIAFLQA